MASWDRNFTGGQYAGNWHSRLDYWEDGKSGNSTLIRLRMYVWCDNGYSQNGLWIPRGRRSWSGEYGGNVNRTINSGHGFVLMASVDEWVGHDVNGNLYVTVGTYCNAPVNDMAWGDIGWNISRIARAPGIYDWTADNITPTSVRLGMEITDHGNGTSSSMYMQYREISNPNWTGTATQGDASGYNYWNVTGLTPGKEYAYRTVVYNNNGDQNISGERYFKTLGVSSIVPLLMDLV